MAAAPFLEVDDIEATYEDVILALRGVSLRVEEGAIVALLGANGAGKTTTLKAISNLLASERGALTRGSVIWKGRSTARLDPAELVARGIVQVLEGRRVFPQLTVEENLLTGGYLRRPSRAEVGNDLARIYTWFPRLKEKRRIRAGLTSGGEQQMIAIGRALMTRPTLVLLDEPSMGLAPIIVQEIFEIIRTLNEDEGVSFLLAEQNAALVLRYADHAYVLETGRLAAAGTAADLAAQGVEALYLGDAPGAAAATSSSAQQF
ncbi:ABC transporter ATP-binding protein [Chelatococcus reniformis]|uniref:ABC transporter ATP-binding protein n=1 Tax=Chelatococcus reniformis TaxID=1494448 RepID=A0A916U0A5_9HYPH|nr:ABC transporter ATP-binding protein [Chelatococcus reniformis]GGC54678.1 ABC transporter ATP-binding protein [Chelatococcus reniformis]